MNIEKERSGGMKLPAKIFIGFIDEEGTAFEEPLWSEQRSFKKDTEYIRLDVVKKAMLYMYLLPDYEVMTDNKKGDEVIKQKLKQAIDNAEKKGVEK